MSEFCPGLSTQVPFHRPRPDDTQLGTSGPGAVITYCQPPPQVLHTDTTLHHYIHTYCISILHGLPGSPYGPTGFANCEVDPAGAQGHQADSLSVVYWWLAVIVKKCIIVLRACFVLCLFWFVQNKRKLSSSGSFLFSSWYMNSL